MKKMTYRHTMYACFTGYIVQAVINNFAPLLFLTFLSTYGIPLSRITWLVTFNFGLQLLVDFLSAKYIDRIGYRKAIVAAHVFSAAGLVALGILPELFSDPFPGLLTAVLIYAAGGGLIEVLISPIMEACPTDNKKGAMSLLHSFYCWGHVGVVLISTLYFAVFGIEHWQVMAFLWALIPAANAVVFLFVPIGHLIEDGEQGLSMTELFQNRVFWLMVLLMVCAGASEQAVSQWASTLVEQGFHVSKTVGDLAGPMFFAVMMGCSRVYFGGRGSKMNLEHALFGSGLLCIFSYLLIGLTRLPVAGLLGCGICGFSVGVFWPGTFSMASASIKRGGTAMFALLALAGDLGCSLGPTVAGKVSSLAADSLQTGILAAVIFPLLLILGVRINHKFHTNEQEELWTKQDYQNESM